MVPMEDYIFSHNYIPQIQLIGPDLEGKTREGEGEERGIELYRNRFMCVCVHVCVAWEGDRERTKWHTKTENKKRI